MKVLEKKMWELEFECYRCESRLVAFSDDVKLAFDNSPYVTCPFCESSTRISLGDIPVSLMIRLITEDGK